MQRVQHRHQDRGHGHQREERKHETRESDRQLDLPRDIAKSGGVQLDQRLGEHDARDDDGAGDQKKDGDDVRGEAPGSRPVSGRERPGECRHERGAQGAFGEQIPQDVRQAEGDAEGVHGIAGTEKIRKNLIADETKDPAGHRRDADDPGRAYELLALRRGGPTRRVAR